MQILDPSEVKKFLGNPDLETLKQFASEHHYPYYDHITEDSNDFYELACLYYAEKKYPEADPIDKVSFATIVSGFTTGLFGSYGTEWYEKEKLANKIVIKSVGGTLDDEGFGTIPERVLRGPDTSRTVGILKLLEDLYFGGGDIARLIESLL